jgi:hypothetical protein
VPRGPKPDGPNPSGNGRPGGPRLTDDLIIEICLYILEGNYQHVAAKKAGIRNRTFQQWLMAGRRFPGGLYEKLLREVRKAEAGAHTLQAKRLYDAGDRDWRAVVTWLERKFPALWGSDRGEIKLLRRRIEALEKRLSPEQLDTPTG